MTTVLNHWKNQFLQASPIWMEAGPQAGPGLGGTNGGGTDGPGPTVGGKHGDDRGHGGRGAGEGGEGNSGTRGGGGGGDDHRRAARFPDIRVSGYDTDDEGNVLQLHPRHPVVYQGEQDVEANVWWINAQRPLAERVITEYGVESTRWRDYLFNRFVEVIQTYFLTNKADLSDPDRLSEQIWDLIGAVHDSAADNLSGLLFAEPSTADRDE